KTTSIRPNTISPLPAPQQQPPLGPPPNPPPQPPGIPGPGRTVSLIDRTWRATDDCGNQSACVQRITVRDSTPPVISAPPDVILQCPVTDTGTNAWTFDTPAAGDTCGSATVTELTTGANVAGHCGNTFDVTRIWRATDACGNTAECSQNVSVEDHTPPTITCAANKTVECGGT